MSPTTATIKNNQQFWDSVTCSALFSPTKTWEKWCLKLVLRVSKSFSPSLYQVLYFKLKITLYLSSSLTMSFYFFSLKTSVSTGAHKWSPLIISINLSLIFNSSNGSSLMVPFLPIKIFPQPYYPTRLPFHLLQDVLASASSSTCPKLNLPSLLLPKPITI